MSTVESGRTRSEREEVSREMDERFEQNAEKRRKAAARIEAAGEELAKLRRASESLSSNGWEHDYEEARQEFVAARDRLREQLTTPRRRRRRTAA